MNLRIPASVPPQVALPPHVQSIGVLNRSLPNDEQSSKVLNVVEGVLTGEGIFEDRQGSMACVAGAHTQLNNDGVVQSILMDTVGLNGVGAGVMPLPLSWAEVEGLCQSVGADALLVLEVFDTDQQGSVTTNTLGQIRNIAEGGSVRPPVPANNPRVFVKMSWRLYDLQTRSVIDEVRLSDYFGVRSGGGVLPDLGEFAKRDAIQQSGYLAGRSYPTRFQSSWIYLGREFYKRKGDAMERAARLVEVNEWDRAAEIWEPLTRSGNNKLAGRACYNMAIAAEVQGDIPAAVDWANRSYGEFGDKRGRDYARILKRRL